MVGDDSCVFVSPAIGQLLDRSIAEDRDATDDERKVCEINTSVYCFDGPRLWPALAQVRADNDQGEYYLTDVIGLLARAGGRIEAVTVSDPVEALGVKLGSTIGGSSQRWPRSSARAFSTD